MSEIKYIEARDRGTFIPVMAVRVMASVRDEDYLLRRAGYGVGMFYVILTNLITNETQSDPYKWVSGWPTILTVHQALCGNWDGYASGDVVDAEFLRGECPAPKTSERFFGVIA